MADWRVDSDSSESSISYGQSLLSKAKKKRKKREKKAKIAKYTALGLGIGDAILAKKANKQIDYLKEEEVFDLNQRKSDWGDKVSFEALYDTIYQKGFNPSKEESYRNYFYDQAATAYNSSNVDKELHPEKDAWIDIEMGNRVKDWKDNLKNWKPWLRATEAEFSQPIADYYKQQVRNVLRPGNTSTVRKVLQKFGLWEDSEIKLTFENGHYAGALRNTKSVDDAYTQAMKNTKDRLEILRGDRPSDTQYEDLPAINKIIKLSKSVNRNMQQQIADSFLADKSGMFFGQSLTLNPENLPAGISPQSAQGEQILRMQALIGKAPTDDSQATGNIFHDTFYKFATRAKQGDEGYDPEKPGLGWTEGEWKNWFNNSDRGKENFQDLLYHRLAGPEATNNLREHFAEEFGGQWTTTGASHMFMLVWGRRAQNLFDIEKRSKGLPLTQGANPADWSPYIEQAFRETVQNDLVLRDDGRLEVVETSAVALLAPDSLGPKPFVEEVDETLVPDTQKPTPTITTTTPPDTTTPPTPVSEELQETIELIRNESVVTRDELELNGPSAVIYNSLDEGTSIKDIKNQIIELSEYFPEEKERMNDVLIDYQEKLIEDLARGVTTTDTTEQQVTLTPQQEGERLASKGRDQIGLAEGIGNAWRNRIEKERRQRLEWRLSGERSVGDNQFARDLKNAGLSENASSREIRDYLYGEEEDILMAAE